MNTQEIMPDWMQDHFKIVAEKYKLSFEDMVKLALSMYISDMLPQMWAEYSGGLQSKELAEAYRALAQNEENRSDFDSTRTKVYEEAEKAARFRSEKEKSTVT